MWKSLFWIPLLILLCVACTTARHVRPQMSDLPRALPGQFQWLEKQSMLSRAPALISQVSQTERMWLNRGHANRVNVLLNAAPNWLELNAFTPDKKGTFFRRVRHELPGLSEHGLSGIYLGPLDEKAGIWLGNGTVRSHDEYGEGAASLEFDPELGDSKDFLALVQDTEKHGLQTGADLFSAATGTGPDFILQARKFAGHSGLYAMLEVPSANWSILPDANSEWDFKKVGKQSIDGLTEAGILPATLLLERLAWLPASGWASTGPVTGVDGRQRRWLYRFYGNVFRPVVLWQDPSGSARQIFSAAVIKQTGLQGQTLTGLHMRPLAGLEPDESGGDNGNLDVTSEALEPFLEAVNEISAQIHRYGGWAMQADPVPVDAISTILDGPCDFCRDEVTPALMAFGLIFSDSRPLARLYQRWLDENLDQSRLARGFNAWRGIDMNILKDSRKRRSLLGKMGDVFGNERILDKRFFKFDYIKDIENNAQSYAHFMLMWRLGLPGLVFINNAELLPGDVDTESGLQQMPRSGQNSPILRLLHARKSHEHAMSRLIGVEKGKDQTLGLLFELPSGAYWLLAGNFKKGNTELNIKLPKPVHTALDVASGEMLTDNLRSEGQKFTVVLDVYQVKNVVFYVN